MSTGIDPYADAKGLGIFREIGDHPYSHVNANEIVERVLKNRAEFEARQKAKGAKTEIEAAMQRRQLNESRGISRFD